MASLRKRPAVDIAPSVEAAIDTPPPAAESAPPQNDATSALQRQIEALRQSESLQQQAQAAMLAAEERRRSWLESTPAAKENVAALGAIHYAALNAGFADTSPEYFNFLENQLAALPQQSAAAAAVDLAEEMQARAEQNRQQPEPPQPKPMSNIVSAPVSREVPSANGQRQSGRITLTREQLDAAKIAGVTPAEYARQLLRLNEMKANGEYGERR